MEKDIEKKNEELNKENNRLKREELKKTLFDEKKVEIPKTKKVKIPLLPKLLSALLLIISLGVSAYLIISSKEKIDYVYQIVNAILIPLITLCIISSFISAYLNKKSLSFILTSLLIIGTLLFNILYKLNIITLPTRKYLPDFTGKQISEVISWAEANKINYKEDYEYSDTTKKYNVIAQNVKEKTLLKDIKNLRISVSNGPDYNKTLILPDMSGWTTDEVIKFVDENFLNNVDITFEENKEIENDKILRQSIIGKIKRNDKILFTASLGNKENLSPINLEDLKDKKLLNATTYLGKHGIIYELKYEFSNTIAKGYIIGTDVEPGTEVKPDEKVILIVSKGKEILVPDVKNKSLKELTNWIIENNLQLEYSDRYDSEIKKGLAIESTPTSGETIEEGSNISIIFSKGKLVLNKFENINDFKTWVTTYGIKHEIKEEFNNDIPTGNIIKFSKEIGEAINQDETLIVYVSKGTPVTIPNFIGKTKNEISSTCNSLGINCSFYNSASDKTEGTAINQSIAANTEVSKGSNISIAIAAKQSVANTSNNNQAANNTQKQNTTPSNAGGNTGGSSTPSCTTRTISITPDMIKIGDPETTCRQVKNNNGGSAYITCEYKDDATNGKKGQILNTRDVQGKTVSSCGKKEAIIIRRND